MPFIGRDQHEQIQQVYRTIKTAKTFQLIEDVTGIAFQIERDNYLKELGKNLLRLTLKKISEMAVAEKNEYAGLALELQMSPQKKPTREIGNHCQVKLVI